MDPFDWDESRGGIASIIYRWFSDLSPFYFLFFFFEDTSGCSELNKQKKEKQCISFSRSHHQPQLLQDAFH